MSLPRLASAVCYMGLNCYSVDGDSPSVLCSSCKLLSKGFLMNRHSGNLQLLKVNKTADIYSSDKKPIFL